MTARLAQAARTASGHFHPLAGNDTDTANLPLFATP